MNFAPDVVPLLLFGERFLVLHLVEFELLLKLFSPILLLPHSLVMALDLQVDLLLFGQAKDLEITALTVGFKMLRYVLEHRVDWKRVDKLMLLSELITHRHVVFVKDLVLTSRNRSDSDYQPIFIGEVLLDKIDAGGDVQLRQVPKQFVHEHKFFRRSHTYAEHNLLLVHAEDHVLSNQRELLFSDVLARQFGQVLAISGLQLPVCLYVFER